MRLGDFYINARIFHGDDCELIANSRLDFSYLMRIIGCENQPGMLKSVFRLAHNFFLIGTKPAASFWLRVVNEGINIVEIP